MEAEYINYLLVPVLGAVVAIIILYLIRGWMRLAKKYNLSCLLKIQKSFMEVSFSYDYDSDLHMLCKEPEAREWKVLVHCANGEKHSPSIETFTPYPGCDPHEGAVAWLVDYFRPETIEIQRPGKKAATIKHPDCQKSKTGISPTNQQQTIKTSDDQGRTILFFHAATGNLSEVEKLIFALPGTGMCPQRLSLISHKDKDGLTAADVAEQNGHEEIATLLRSEQGRMEFFE